jgi:nitroreductase
MEFSDVLKKRKSIRSFTGEKVPDDMLRELVEAGCLAPSASNLEAWRFFVATDPALVHKIDVFSPGLSGNPPAIIAIASDMKEVEKRGSENSIKYGCLMDAAMAAENIMLKATDLGLGTCAIKSYNDAAVRKILNLPEWMRLEILITFGFPCGNARSPEHRSADKVMIFNTWEEGRL